MPPVGVVCHLPLSNDTLTGACMGLQSLVQRIVVSDTQGRSHWCTRLQPLMHRSAGSGTEGCRKASLPDAAGQPLVVTGWVQLG